MCLGIGLAECVCRDGDDEVRAHAHSDAYDPYQDDPDDTTPDEVGDEEDAVQQEKMAEAGHTRPDTIDWMRDGDTRHFYDE